MHFVPTVLSTNFPKDKPNHNVRKCPFDYVRTTKRLKPKFCFYGFIFAVTYKYLIFADNGDPDQHRAVKVTKKEHFLTV